MCQSSNKAAEALSVWKRVSAAQMPNWRDDHTEFWPVDGDGVFRDPPPAAIGLNNGELQKKASQPSWSLDEAAYLLVGACPGKCSVTLTVCRGQSPEPPESIAALQAVIVTAPIVDRARDSIESGEIRRLDVVENAAVRDWLVDPHEFINWSRSNYIPIPASVSSLFTNPADSDDFYKRQDLPRRTRKSDFARAVYQTAEKLKRRNGGPPSGEEVWREMLSSNLEMFDVFQEGGCLIDRSARTEKKHNRAAFRKRWLDFF